MKAQIEILSCSLIGSGEGFALVDADVIFNDQGFPYIPAKRIKGLLKESALEISEILGLGNAPVYSIFGKDGFQEAKLTIYNFYLPNFETLSKEISCLKNYTASGLPQLLSHQNIVSYYTTFIQQTAVEEGIAKDTSLRTYRVLKPPLKFEGEILGDNLDLFEKAVLYLAFINLRKIGTRRNRGFGKVKASIGLFEDLEKALEIIEKSKKQPPFLSPQEMEKKEVSIRPSQDLGKLEFTIRCLLPVVISRQYGDQNTVSTDKYISGSALRGAILNYIFQNFKISETLNEHFLANLFFSPAYPYKNGNIFYPTPLALQTLKNDRSNAFNVLSESHKLSEKTTPLREFASIDENCETYTPHTLTNFHNTRDRLLGHSYEDIEGGIFYYEAIAENEIFKGYILGDKNFLELIKEKLDGQRLKIGKSKSAQYGTIEIKFENKLNESNIGEEDMDDEFYIVAISPIVLYNENGISDPSARTLQNYLLEYFCCNVEIKESISKTTFVESYASLWKSKTQRDYAIAEGSTFKLKFFNKLSPHQIDDLKNKGIGEKLEQGCGKILLFRDFNDSYSVKKVEEPQNRQPFKIEETIKVSEPLIKELLKEALYRSAESLGFTAAEDDKKEVRGKLTGHFVSRIRSIVEGSRSEEEIKQKLSQCKGPAKKKLEDFRVKELIKRPTLQEALVNIENIKNKIKSDIKLEPKDMINDLIENLSFELFKKFWISFLTTVKVILKDQVQSNAK